MRAGKYLMFKNIIKSLTENQAKITLLAILAGKRLEKALELASENLTVEDLYKKIQKKLDDKKEIR